MYVSYTINITTNATNKHIQRINDNISLAHTTNQRHTRKTVAARLPE